jgi:hypothetical protein
MNLRALTMEDVAGALGYPKPVQHRARVCEYCGADELVWGDEYTTFGNDPDGWSGYEIEYCAACGRAS